MKWLPFLLLFAACTPCRYVSRHPECFPADTVRITNIRIERDTITYIEESESTLEAYFECDSNNQVLMKRLAETNTGNIKPTVIFRDNTLKISYYVDSIAVLHKIIKETSGKETTILNPVNEQMKKDLQRLKKWRKIGMYGIGLAVLVLLYALFKIYRKFL